MMLIRSRRIAITIFHPEIRTHFDYAARILVDAMNRVNKRIGATL